MKKILWVTPTQFIIVLLAFFAGFALGYFGGSAPAGSVHNTREWIHFLDFNLTTLGVALGLGVSSVFYCMFRAINSRA